MKKLRVLAFVDYYLPGYKGGGPAHSVSRLIKLLAEDVEFFVFTRDRDLGDDAPYPDVRTSEWIERDGVRCRYSRPDRLGFRWIVRAVREVGPDVIYLNSYFSRFSRSVLFARLLGQLGGIAVLVAPRGEFSSGALGIKRFKKSLYLWVSTRLGLHRGVTWQVSSIHELADTRAVVDGEPAYFIKAPDILDPVGALKTPNCANKVSGEARFVFLSRIAPIKNLEWAIQRLAKVLGDVRFTIYGPAEDKAYWTMCEAAIRELPANVRCEHLGPVPCSEVVARLSEHHFFLFPTQGENFGHVIAEALTSGCPVLLSDRTPWRDLDEEGAGWVMPLEDSAEWERRIQSCIDMDAAEFEAMSEAARAYICRLAAASTDSQASLQMFESAIDNQAAA